MRGRSKAARAVVALSILSILTACGDSADSADSTIGGVEVVSTTLAAPAVTDPPSDTSTSSTSTTSTTSSTSTTAPPTTLPEQNCLEGSWWLSPEGVSNLYTNLLPGFPVTVTGSHWVDVVGDTIDVRVVLYVSFAIGGTEVGFGIDQLGTGTYTVTDDVLAISYDTFESIIHDGHGEAINDPSQNPDTYVDTANRITDNGDGTITIDRVTLPLIEIPPVAGGPVGCDEATMSLGFTSGLADTAAVYTRRP